MAQPKQEKEREQLFRLLTVARWLATLMVVLGYGLLVYLLLGNRLK